MGKLKNPECLVQHFFSEMQIRKDELNILLFMNAYFDRINCQLSIVLRQGQNISYISDP